MLVLKLISSSPHEERPIKRRPVRLVRSRRHNDLSLTMISMKRKLALTMVRKPPFASNYTLLIFREIIGLQL